MACVVQLAYLAAARADTRGMVEAEAYSAWLAGVALVEVRAGAHVRTVIISCVA